MIDPKDLSRLQPPTPLRDATHTALDEEKKQQASSSVSDTLTLVGDAVDLATNGAGSAICSAAGAAVDGIGSLTSGAAEIVGGIIGSLFDA